MTLAYSQIPFEIREVVLKDKPKALLEASPKATVPVLVLGDGSVIDESLDIMDWALSYHDPDGWLGSSDSSALGKELLVENEGSFKPMLDRYKYSVRHPQTPQEVSRSRAEVFLKRLEARLETQPFLLGETLQFADVAIFPFVRQFANVDHAWFLASPYVALRAWLQCHLDSSLFEGVMNKYPPWREGDSPLIFGTKSVMKKAPV